MGSDGIRLTVGRIVIDGIGNDPDKQRLPNYHLCHASSAKSARAGRGLVRNQWGQT